MPLTNCHCPSPWPLPLYHRPSPWPLPHCPSYSESSSSKADNTLASAAGGGGYVHPSWLMRYSGLGGREKGWACLDVREQSRATALFQAGQRGTAQGAPVEEQVVAALQPRVTSSRGSRHVDAWQEAGGETEDRTRVGSARAWTGKLTAPA